MFFIFVLLVLIAQALRR